MQPMLFHDLPLCLPCLPPPAPSPSAAFERLATADADDLDAVIAELLREGWTYAADDSCYCKVLLSRDSDRVLKLGCGFGAGSTVEASLALPDNPHLPTVFGFQPLGEEGDYEFVAEMEFLEPLPDKDDWGGGFDDTAPSDEEECDNCPSFYRWRASVPWEGGDVDNGPDLSRLPDGPLKDAFTALADRAFGCSWDVHDGNIMLRPGTGEVVLNDLLA